jgi:hypothetical protein
MKRDAVPWAAMNDHLERERVRGGSPDPTIA